MPFLLLILLINPVTTVSILFQILSTTIKSEQKQFSVGDGIEYNMTW